MHKKTSENLEPTVVLDKPSDENVTMSEKMLKDCHLHNFGVCDGVCILTHTPT